MRRKQKRYDFSFSKREFQKILTEQNPCGSVRMLSMNPQTGVRMIYSSDPELEELFGDDTEIIFSLETKNIYLSCVDSELIHVGKRVYLVGTGIIYKLNQDDDYEDMSADDMADSCLEVFSRLQRIRMSDFGCIVIDLTDAEDESHEEKE